MAQQNSIANKSSELTVDPAEASDSFVQFDESTTGKWRIGNDATDDSYRLSVGSALGTNDTFLMTAAGECTMPLNPAFLARVDSTISNITGDGTAYTIVFDAEVFDQNSDWSSPNFTAPITGRYWLTGASEFSGLTSSHVGGYLWIATSNRIYYMNRNNAFVMAVGGTTAGWVSTAFADMDAADTAQIVLRIDDGTKVVDLVGGDVLTFFSGYLAA